ncbi:MAG: 2-isopropylmalate synthase [Candidatus Treponema excrementipullorum]|uniref:2-isopropylmalate synthase n=1 Tax=Candidatus Treponema excrementipullorum TaxID=2838768 RepID=A0A9E2L496_9SPIR|nr:2-isopropylmalate synthase [Candidatus Treponema excrementipullorum]MCI7588415.1 2-isopropylmalate synthase [Spirochaetia bacterium]MDY2754964.1 2-isopropylmalate synthase [Candidatus Treponema excrementipullorum]MDY4466526.1 2-isopropylmalate synthase [Candidatus Treponema excrementipullorum]
MKNAAKYKPFGKIPLENRQWPDKEITHPPIWCSVDLRDGNQALAIPMGIQQKLAYFDLLVKIGFKEIEVGFPSASQTEYDFLRRLIDDNRIPDDVTIQVLCQARQHLVEKTFQCLKGVKKAIFHIYNSTSPAQRKYTFNKTKEEIIDIAVEGVKCVKSCMPMVEGTDITLEYSPESFSSTEIDFSVEICEAVKKEWQPTPQNKIIFNLPTTVECATPNIHADQIEYFSTHISDRDSVIVSLHNHNDRGEGVASCELALLAGADRVEGTLFGNGERTGNLDITTVALNMFSQGVDPQLDLSNIGEIATLYTKLTGMPIHPRHPYSGELVFTAFSGSHQDAIRKGMAARKNMPENAIWDVPYLPIDPHDIGREYEEIIRINSQSGKGGSAWILEQDYGIYLPKAMHPAVGAVITSVADSLQREVTPQEIFNIFEKQWLTKNAPLKLIDIAETHLETRGDVPQVMCRGTVEWHGEKYTIGATGNGPLDAFVAGLKETSVPNFSISAFHEHSIGTGSDTDAMAYIEITFEDGKKFWGCGRSSNIGRAGIKAVISAINQTE